MEEYLERLVLKKVELQEANSLLMRLVSYLSTGENEQLPLSITRAALLSTPEVTVTSPDGETFEVKHA